MDLVDMVNSSAVRNTRGRRSPVFPLGYSSSESFHYPDQKKHQCNNPKQIENHRSDGDDESHDNPRDEQEQRDPKQNVFHFG
jgi:hypothetical protein